MTTHQFYSDSETHSFIPKLKNLKLYFLGILKTIGMAVPGPIVTFINNFFKLNNQYLEYATVILAIASLIAISFLTGRKFFINDDIKQSQAIHNGLHHCRDLIIKIQHTKDPSKNIPALSDLCGYVCTTAQEIFNARKKNEIGVAIRLLGCDSNHKGCYSTVYRYGNLSPSRTTTHIEKNKGVASTLINNNKIGCVIYPNIHEATCEEFVRSSNEDQFKNEVKSMIVAPICIQEADKKEMIGILHISSNKTDKFNQDDVAITKALADMAATTLAHMFDPSENDQDPANVDQDPSHPQKPHIEFNQSKRKFKRKITSKSRKIRK